MNASLQQFRNCLQEQHYSLAFMQHLVDTITNSRTPLPHPDITTLQEIYELVEKESNLIIAYFQANPLENKLL